MEGAETQTRLRGASLQTDVLKAQKKRQREECVNMSSFFFFFLNLLCLMAATVAVCSISPSVQLSLDICLLFYPVLEFSC